MGDLHFETKALHTGYEYTAGRNIFPPLHMGVAFPFQSGEEAQRICAGEEEGYVYARTRNPTNTILEERLAALENGEACLVTSSGLAAIFLTVLGLVREPGAEFVTSSRMYGNAQRQFRFTLPLLNINARWVEAPDRLEVWEALISKNTRFLFVETPSNPDAFVADVVGLAKLAAAYQIPLVVDSTLATPAVMRPLDLGADVVIHSTTKYLAGHSAALGGAIISKKEFIVQLRTGHHHYIGPTMSAFNAWLTLMGMETLGIRMAYMIDSAQQIAEFLDSHPRVQSVNYPGLRSHPQYELARSQMARGGGTSLISFVVEGGQRGAWSVIERLKIPCHATHLGGNQTVVVHPATTTHGKLTPEQRAASNVPDGLIRYCVGLENPEDLKADLAQALET